jgi:hypothetical protein
VHQKGRSAGVGKSFDGFADCVVFVGAHGAFAQPQQVAVCIVQRNGMGASGLEGCANLLANGIEIDERTVRRAE